MPNYHFCSDGSKVSQATIDRKRSETYKQLYAGEPHPRCAGCGTAAQGTAHIVPQAVCKVEGISEYCWLKVNMFPSCHRCNAVAENFRSEEFLLLRNAGQIVEITKQICLSRYFKMCEVGVTIERFQPLKQS